MIAKQTLEGDALNVKIKFNIIIRIKQVLLYKILSGLN
jgi:hypothetical protein